MSQHLSLNTLWTNMRWDTTTICQSQSPSFHHFINFYIQIACLSLLSFVSLYTMEGPLYNGGSYCPSGLRIGHVASVLD